MLLPPGRSRKPTIRKKARRHGIDGSVGVGDSSNRAFDIRIHSRPAFPIVRIKDDRSTIRNCNRRRFRFEEPVSSYSRGSTPPTPFLPTDGLVHGGNCRVCPISLFSLLRSLRSMPVANPRICVREKFTRSDRLCLWQVPYNRLPREVTSEAEHGENHVDEQAMIRSSRLLPRNQPVSIPGPDQLFGTKLVQVSERCVSGISLPGRVIYKDG
jgi:hypothetical protein